MAVDGDILTLAELRQLREERPEKLFAHLASIGREFVFGVEDHREDQDEWGGEFRVLLNRNIEVHLVPRFNKAMEDDSELPQFAIVPDAERAGQEVPRKIEIDSDGETVEGITFYVDPERYDRLVEELSEIVERYDDFDVIPDTYFLETELVAFLTGKVLENTVVQAERAFDFRRGLVGGQPPRDDDAIELDHDQPATD